jgi:hypothetical protein
MHKRPPSAGTWPSLQVYAVAFMHSERKPRKSRLVGGASFTRQNIERPASICCHFGPQLRGYLHHFWTEYYTIFIHQWYYCLCSFRIWIYQTPICDFWPKYRWFCVRMSLRNRICGRGKRGCHCHIQQDAVHNFMDYISEVGTQHCKLNTFASMESNYQLNQL